MPWVKSPGTKRDARGKAPTNWLKIRGRRRRKWVGGGIGIIFAEFGGEMTKDGGGGDKSQEEEDIGKEGHKRTNLSEEEGPIRGKAKGSTQKRRILRFFIFEFWTEFVRFWGFSFFLYMDILPCPNEGLGRGIKAHPCSCERPKIRWNFVRR